MLSREWRYSWSSADRRCSNYIWVMDNFIAYWGSSYIRDFTVYIFFILLIIHTHYTCRRRAGFDSVWDYYEWASCKKYIQNVSQMWITSNLMLGARLWYLQCFSTGDTAVLYLAIKLSSLYYWNLITNIRLQPHLSRTNEVLICAIWFQITNILTLLVNTLDHPIIPTSPRSQWVNICDLISDHEHSDSYCEHPRWPHCTQRVAWHTKGVCKWVQIWITLALYMLLPLFATRFTDYA